MSGVQNIGLGGNYEYNKPIHTTGTVASKTEDLDIFSKNKKDYSSSSENVKKDEDLEAKKKEFWDKFRIAVMPEEDKNKQPKSHI